MIITKKQAFTKQIRSKQRNSILKEMRIRMIKMEAIHHLNHLMEIVTNSESLTFQQFILLTQWGRHGERNAIFFLGNLIIDEIFSIPLLSEYENRLINYFQNQQGWLGFSPQYLWILHILYEKNHFNQKQLIHLCKLIYSQIQEYRNSNQIQKINSQVFLAQHGIALLRKIFRSHSLAIELLLSEENQQLQKKLIKSIIKISQSGLDHEITFNCFSIINTFLTALQDESKICHLIGQKELSRLIFTGTFRQQSSLRSLSYQILINTLISFSSIDDSFLQIILSSYLKFPSEKRSVRTQISYLLRSFTQNIDKFSQKQLSEKIKLIQIIRMMINSCKEKEEAINCMESIELLKLRKKSQHISLYQMEYLNSISSNYCLSNILTIWAQKFENH